MTVVCMLLNIGVNSLVRLMWNVTIRKLFKIYHNSDISKEFILIAVCNINIINHDLLFF